MAFGYPFSRLRRQLPRPHPSACGCHLPQRGYVACWGLESSTAVVSPDHGPLPPLRGTFSVRGEGCASCLARMFCRRARAPSRLPQEKGDREAVDEVHGDVCTKTTRTQLLPCMVSPLGKGGPRQRWMRSLVKGRRFPARSPLSGCAGLLCSRVSASRCGSCSVQAHRRSATG